jgi:hypothetical protein
MHNKKTINVRTDPANSMVVREIWVDDFYNNDKARLDRKVVIKVLKKQISSGLEAVTIQLGYEPQEMR